MLVPNHGKRRNHAPGRKQEMRVSNKPIGACSICHEPIYAGQPRRGIWRFVLPPRIVRTCMCFDVMTSTIQHALVTGSPLVGAMAMMPRRDDER